MDSGISEILEQTLEALGGLQQALQEEAEALAGNRDPDAIANLAQSKQQSVTRINELMQAGDRCLTESGYSAGRAGLERWLDGLAADHPARDTWRAIVEISTRCRDLNEINGVQINLLSQRTQEALGILFGLLGGNETETYGPDGNGRPSSVQRTSFKV